MSLDNKVAIITGSTAGIGRSTAILFAKRGALVTIHGRRQERLDEISEEIKQIAGYEPVQVCCDIEDATVRKQLVAITVARYGRIDILISNAGYCLQGGWKSPIEDLRRMFECHCIAPFELTQLCMPHLLKTKGSIVMVSSVAAMKGIADSLAYSVAKAGLDNMMRCLALEVAKDGVRVNSVNPGGVITEIFRDPKLMEAFKKVAESGTPFHPNGRFGQPEEIATAIAYMASDEASMITGTTLAIDGGLTAALKG